MNEVKEKAAQEEQPKYDWHLKKVFIDGIMLNGEYRPFPNYWGYIGLYVNVCGELVADRMGRIIGKLEPAVRQTQFARLFSQ